MPRPICMRVTTIFAFGNLISLKQGWSWILLIRIYIWQILSGARANGNSLLPRQRGYIPVGKSKHIFVPLLPRFPAYILHLLYFVAIWFPICLSLNILRFNTHYWRRVECCKSSIRVVNNCQRTRKIAELLDYVPIYHYTILHRADHKGQPSLTPLHIREWAPR